MRSNEAFICRQRALYRAAGRFSVHVVLNPKVGLMGVGAARVAERVVVYKCD